MKFFGCIARPGHYLWTDSLECLFGGKDLAPFGPDLDTGYCPGGNQVQGQARLVHEHGHTVLAFWDRSVDTRPGSNAAFIEEGTHTFEDMLKMAREKFPSIMNRFRFEIVLALESK